MIKFKSMETKEGIASSFVVEAGEPITITQMTTDKNHTVVYVYRGTNVTEYDEPIGGFDTACNPSPLSWVVK